MYTNSYLFLRRIEIAVVVVKLGLCAVWVSFEPVSDTTVTEGYMSNCINNVGVYRTRTAGTPTLQVQ